MILDSKNIKYEAIDITEPGKEEEKDFMQTNSKNNGGTIDNQNPKYPLPPQLFNDTDYCGDYEAFDLANEIDTLEQFLKLAPADTTNVSSTQIELKKDTTDNAATPSSGEKEAAVEGEANKENNHENQEV
uniref:SH3 domain-binding glutamic acid-rich-like protein n=1 Tax=Megaselia scalaris TaxID=36166 RepID=T1H1K9_MEGSC